MKVYQASTKRAVVELALRRLVETMERKELLKREGAGWQGDLWRLCAMMRIADRTCESCRRLVVPTDTSDWIEFLRATDSRVHVEVRSLLKSGRLILTSDAVTMELLAGAGDEQRTEKLRRFPLA